jgi:phage baseplate assembly protein W
MPEPHDFLGIGWAFPPTFRSASASVQMVRAAEDIKQSLRILLTTTMGERLMQPTYGCDLRRYLFEPFNATLAGLIQELVTTAILYHEPRIRPDTVRLEPVPEQGLLLIHVGYIVRATNSRQNFVFPFYKEEGSKLAQ